MKETTKTASQGDEISFDEFDEINHPRPEECEFDRVVESAISRRGFMGGVLAFGGVSLLAGTSSLVARGDAMAAPNRFGFGPVAANTDDTITLIQASVTCGNTQVSPKSLSIAGILE